MTLEGRHLGIPSLGQGSKLETLGVSGTGLVAFGVGGAFGVWWGIITLGVILIIIYGLVSVARVQRGEAVGEEDG